MVTEDQIEEVLTDIETKFLRDLKSFDCKAASEKDVEEFIKELDRIKKKLSNIVGENKQV